MDFFLSRLSKAFWKSINKMSAFLRVLFYIFHEVAEVKYDTANTVSGDVCILLDNKKLFSVPLLLVDPPSSLHSPSSASSCWC